MENFEVRYAPAESARVGRFVVASFFTPRELPLALGRALLTRDFLLGAGLPLLVIGAAYAAPEGALRLGLLWAALAWLSGAAFRLLSLGKSRGIGCWTPEGTLAGALRMKVSRRRILLAGVLVEPAWRGRGIYTALLLAAFRLAAASPGPRTLAVFAPAHPASKHVVEKYFEGAISIPVGGEVFMRGLAALEADLAALEAKGIRHRLSLAAL